MNAPDLNHLRHSGGQGVGRSFDPGIFGGSFSANMMDGFTGTLVIDIKERIFVHS